MTRKRKAPRKDALDYSFNPDIYVVVDRLSWDREYREWRGKTGSTDGGQERELKGGRDRHTSALFDNTKVSKSKLKGVIVPRTIKKQTFSVMSLLMRD